MDNYARRFQSFRNELAISHSTLVEIRCRFPTKTVDNELMMNHPLLIKNFIHESILNKMRMRMEFLKTDPETKGDTHFFFRKEVPNDPFFSFLHHSLFHHEVMNKTGLNVKPTYCFASMYYEGLGICPIHIDREQCYLTLDICIDQKEPWPLYVNAKDHHSLDQLSGVELQKVKDESDEYLMNPGDALIYFGSSQPHWRQRLGPGNYCDLVFFHFVPGDFEGNLT